MKRSAAVQPPDCDMAIGCCDRRENAVAVASLNRLMLSLRGTQTVHGGSPHWPNCNLFSLSFNWRLSISRSPKFRLFNTSLFGMMIVSLKTGAPGRFWIPPPPGAGGGTVGDTPVSFGGSTHKGRLKLQVGLLSWEMTFWTVTITETHAPIAIKTYFISSPQPMPRRPERCL